MLPRVSWSVLSKDVKNISLLGFIGYKVGMKSAYVKDDTQHSLTKGKRIIVPVTIIECPSVKILSVRFYKYKKVIGEVLNSNIDKEVKKKIKVPKEVKKKIEDFKEDYDDLKVIIYSQVKKTNIKRKPDFIEVGLSGSKEDKLNFVKENLTKEISVKDIFKEGTVDVRGVTKGKGTQGATKRFGLALKSHKAEKGQRGAGSGGAWHPARVLFTEPRAGQMGFHTRANYDNKIVHVNSIEEKNINPKSGFKKFGKIKTDYLILFGSILGPSKRQLLITAPLRKSKRQVKKTYELIELR